MPYEFPKLIIDEEAITKKYQYTDQPCSHEKTEHVKSEAKNGVMQIRKQCMDCGSFIGQFVSKTLFQDYEIELMLSPIEFNPDKCYGYKSNTKNSYLYCEREKIKKQHKIDWIEAYNNYLKTPEWENKRKLVLKRANGICEGCLEKQPSHVHHKTYKNIGNEFMFELIALCESCHLRYHNIQVIYDTAHKPF